MQVGELVVLPAVRHAPKDTLIVADGFSCRSQIAQATDRRALHFADLLEMAYRNGTVPSGDYPERAYVPDYSRNGRVGAAMGIAGVVIGAAVGIALWRRRK